MEVSELEKASTKCHFFLEPTKQGRGSKSPTQGNLIEAGSHRLRLPTKISSLAFKLPPEEPPAGVQRLVTTADFP